MENQTEVRLIGFRCEKHNIIAAVELQADILTQRLIQITGDSGNGKSSLLDALMTAIHGSDAIKKKDALLPGFLAEVQLIDGEINLFVGARKRELSKGQRAGEYEVETYLYAKDADGKQYTPIIDGETATAAKYMKLLTTELTFNMQDFFTENPTAHRKLIERLFADELANLGADETVLAINSLREKRDAARVLTQRNGAYMEAFQKEGLSEDYLAGLKEVDIAEIDKKISEATILRDRIINPSESKHTLECERLDAARAKELQTIKDEIVRLEGLIRDDNAAKAQAYTNAKAAYDKQEENKVKYASLYTAIKEAVEKYFGKDAEGCVEAMKPINARKEHIEKLLILVEPVAAAADEKLAKDLDVQQAALKQLNDTPIVYPEKAKPDTMAIDATLKELNAERSKAERENLLVERYKCWLEWIAAKGAYEVKVDELRRMYAKIDTGVEGLKIVPVDTNTDKVEVWLMYNGQYDQEFFQNPDKEMRWIFSYSSFQRSAIGVMLQAARLNLKPKALRLAIVDDVAFTKKGLAVLSKLCHDLNVKLITSRTDDITKDQIKDGEVLMEGGVAFFKDNQK